MCGFLHLPSNKKFANIQKSQSFLGTRDNFVYLSLSRDPSQSRTLLRLMRPRQLLRLPSLLRKLVTTLPWPL